MTQAMLQTEPTPGAMAPAGARSNEFLSFTLRNEEYGIEILRLEDCKPADAVVLAVAHREFVEEGWTLVRRLLRPEGGFVADVQGQLDRASRPADVTLWRL